MQKQYPEVHSLEESLAILKKYKDDVNKEDYEGIKSVISNHAIESIYRIYQNLAVKPLALAMGI
ncbi:TPA: hypothetical protein R9A30_001733 [Campylobacter coli]|nr:hypothetical protein [Campylobacter coli]